MSSTECENGYEFECDSCHKVIEAPRMGRGSDKPDFMMCFARIKEKGWRAYKVTSRDGRVETWKHKCPSC